MRPSAFPVLERRVSRTVLLAGLAMVLAGMFLSEGGRLPPRVVTALVAAFVAMKLGLGLLARRAGWRGWPALVAEGLAFVAIGAVVGLGLPVGAGGSDQTGVLLVLLTAVLLGVGMWLRRRALLAELDASDESAAEDSEPDEAGDDRDEAGPVSSDPSGAGASPVAPSGNAAASDRGSRDGHGGDRGDGHGR